MATANTLPQPDVTHRRMLIRAVVASTVGTAIEWYDFFLYSTVTGLVFAKEFFPKSDPLVGTLQAFLIYAVGFVARPIGAAIFGHYGDRLGRKAALVSTLLLMGIATLLVAFVPNVVLEKWMNEEGVPVLGLPADEFARFIRRKLNDPDWRNLRTR